MDGRAHAEAVEALQREGGMDGRAALERLTDPFGWMAAARRQQFADSYRWFQRGLALLGTPAFDIRQVVIGGQATPVQMRVAAQSPFCRLTEFRLATESTHASASRQRILLCAPLAGHRAVQLSEAIRSLLPDADVYVTDWIDARDIPLDAGAFSLESYVRHIEGYLRLLEPAGLHVVAVCQATVPVLAALVRVAEQGGGEPSTLTLIGGPVDAREGQTPLGRTAATLPPAWFEANAMVEVPAGFVGEGRRVYPGFLQFQALVMAQPQRHWSLLSAWSCRWLGDKARLRALETEFASHAAVLDIDARFFLDTVDVVYRQALLPRGQWRIDAEPVRLDRIQRTRLLTVEAARDDISGPGQTHAAHRLCSGLAADARERITVADADHYGLFGGQTWREQVHPRLRQWMAAADAADLTATARARPRPATRRTPES
ncbi:polyhydroxyalkanoate depolymerase [Cupriavidus sp. AU9028]|uniref:polyhydroxyalkanoate depolymerase n=1 Tax=Cupriavidus sp. AU9028 TaxID=2871157 RepID=UPI001C954C32|nr:polyhydroxyalkanoate depolymerase [Cupriavidus sp. AU9028]MBY4895622.1 polyhydroxyalkanoate depolymerase [Cupriavidus sp. AU9028]